MYFKKLEGTNIYLSPLAEGDYDKFTSWMNEIEGTIYTNTFANVYTERAEKEYIDERSKAYCFAIVKTKENELIGNIELFDLDLINGMATMGIYIGNKSERSKGYGFEAINLILDYGFNVLNLHSINLTVASFNERAISLYKKCGFKYAGELRESRKILGKYYSTVYMDILEDEYKSTNLKEKIEKVLNSEV